MMRLSTIEHGSRVNCGLSLKRMEGLRFSFRGPVIRRKRCHFGGNGAAWQGRIRLLSVFYYNVENCRCHRQNVSSKMEDTMSQNKDDTAADLHIYAAHAHTAAAAAHHRGDHEAAEELSSRAQDYSMAASEKTVELAKQIRVPIRA